MRGPREREGLEGAIFYSCVAYSYTSAQRRKKKALFTPSISVFILSSALSPPGRPLSVPHSVVHSAYLLILMSFYSLSSHELF